MTQPVASEPIVQDCLAAGFALAGVAPCEPPSRVDAFHAWLDGGNAGSMDWMHRAADVRSDPRLLLDGARSIIVVADRYPPRKASPGPGDAGRVAAYALGRDYHRHMKRRLHRCCDAWAAAHPGASFRACVDTAPLLERAAAEAAGIGRVGKNTMLIEPGTGSWLLLGAVLTTLDLTPTRGNHAEPCGTCTKCIDACPTQALQPWTLDARRCLSAITIEHRGEYPDALADLGGDWLFGCDVCQDVCPHNGDTRRTRSADTDPAYDPRAGDLSVSEILDWDASDRIEAIAGTPMTRANLDMWRRNACVVAGNLLMRGEGSSALRARLVEIAGNADEPESVRSAARASLNRLSGPR